MEMDYIKDIIENAKCGDKGSLEALYKETYNRVYFYAYKIFGNENDAADVVQEVYIKVFTHISELQDVTAFPNWLYKITINECRQLMRKDKKQILLEEGDQLFENIVDSAPEIDLNVIRKDARSYLMAIIDLLPREQKSAVILYYYEQLTIAQIAEIEGVSESTIKSRLSQARRKIRNAVEAEERRIGGKILVSGLPALAAVLAEGALLYTMPPALASKALAVALATVGFVDGEATVSFVTVNDGEEDKGFFGKLRSSVILEVKPYKLVILLVVLMILGLAFAGAWKGKSSAPEDAITEEPTQTATLETQDESQETGSPADEPEKSGQTIAIPEVGQENIYIFKPEKSGYYCIEGAFPPGKFSGKSVDIVTYENSISPGANAFQGVVSEYVRSEGNLDIYKMYFTEDGSLQADTTYYIILTFEEEFETKDLRIVETSQGVVEF